VFVVDGFDERWRVREGVWEWLRAAKGALDGCQSADCMLQPLARGSRAEQSRAEQSRAEQSRAEQSRAGSCA